MDKNALLESISNTISDYRSGEILAPTPEHVEKWISQFNKNIHFELLAEIDYLFKQTYIQKERVILFLSNLIYNTELTANSPMTFWKNSHILDIQQNGSSQRDMINILMPLLASELFEEISQDGIPNGSYVYIDDMLFTGNRAYSDLAAWMGSEITQKLNIHIIVMFAYQYGVYTCKRRLKEAALRLGKELKLQIWFIDILENRKAYKDRSDVFWLTNIPDNQIAKSYLSKSADVLEFRTPSERIACDMFSSEKGRQLLEKELFIAGTKIINYCSSPSKSLPPFGFGYGFGFGAAHITYRNCPNNCPLAFWWGNPNAGTRHPFQKWYPLLPRKTYGE